MQVGQNKQNEEFLISQNFSGILKYVSEKITLFKEYYFSLFPSPPPQWVYFNHCVHLHFDWEWSYISAQRQPPAPLATR